MKDVGKSIVVVGSRSGGHILPGLAKGREYGKKGLRVYFIAEDRPLDRGIIEQESWLAGSIFLKLQAPLLHKWWKYPWYACHFFKMFTYCLFFLYSHKISRVISMGGYSSIPVCCAAWVLRIPYDLYELNAELGRAVAWLRYRAAVVICCFPEALEDVPAHARHMQEYPVRYKHDDLIDSVQARCAIGLQPHRYTLFVLGGSQGSQSLSQVIITWLKNMDAEQRSKIQIIHQTGEYIHEVRASYQELSVEAVLFDYSDTIISYYSAADLVVTRAGSGALHEVMELKKCALIVPLETTTTRHQVSNAQSVQKRDPERWKMIRQYDQEQLYEFLNAQIPKD